MRHRRGINLIPEDRDEIDYLGAIPEVAHTTFGDIPNWHHLGGHCSKCEREGWVNRAELAEKWGSSAYLGPLAPRLRCLGCGNKNGNKWIIGKLKR